MRPEVSTIWAAQVVGTLPLQPWEGKVSMPSTCPWVVRCWVYILTTRVSIASITMGCGWLHETPSFTCHLERWSNLGGDCRKRPDMIKQEKTDRQAQLQFKGLAVRTLNGRAFEHSLCLRSYGKHIHNFWSLSTNKCQDFNQTSSLMVSAVSWTFQFIVNF